jgi:16S rRNA (uracil1498-N3)-methyltransferase
MTAPMFYLDAGSLDDAVVGDVLTLSGDEGRHAVTVKRLRAGESVLIGDGHGLVCESVVEGTDGKQLLRARVRDVVRSANENLTVTVVQALIKGDRMDRALETMTEAGVDSIAVWSSSNVVVRLGPDQRVKVSSRFSKKVTEASKQARRATVPEVDGPLDTVAVLARVAACDVAILLDETAGVALPQVLPASAAAGGASRDGRTGYLTPRDLVLIVGPEGGLTGEERAALTAAGALRARMGPEVLRASTAATVALGWVMGALGKWSMSD